VQYSPEQINVLRETCVVARGALDAVVRAARVGVTTEELDKICHAYITAHGGYPSPLNYYNFPKSCCTSVNEVICHGIPDARPLQDGDVLNVDVTAYLRGYHGDLNETVCVGNCDEKSKKLLMTAYKCLFRAIEGVKPGARYRDIGEEVTRVAHRRDASVVKSYCGHGIGTLFHCAPNVPHYARNKAAGAMRAGMTFTIEPMVNEGSRGVKTWPDGWTAVTADGRRSAQYEHTLLVTEGGVDVLTARNEKSPRVFPWTDPDHLSTEP
jgi:methionyl aminopeptidase